MMRPEGNSTFGAVLAGEPFLSTVLGPKGSAIIIITSSIRIPCTGWWLVYIYL